MARTDSGRALSWTRDGRDWPHREASRFVEAGGLTWHVQMTGRGPPLLLVHGTGASTHSWRDLIALLADRFEVVAPDLPGHAFSGTPASSRMSLPGMASALTALVRALGVTPRIVVGHSAGAAILAQMCLDRSIAPAGLISLNGAMLPIGGVAGQIFSPLARILASGPALSRLFAWWAGDATVVARLIAQTGSKLDRAGLAFYRRLAGDPRHAAGALSMMANWNLGPLERRLPTLTTPLVLAVGSRDGSISPNDAFRIRDLVPGSRIEQFRGLGHLAHEEDPAAIMALIERYAAVWDVFDAAEADASSTAAQNP